MKKSLLLFSAMVASAAAWAQLSLTRVFAFSETMDSHQLQESTLPITPLLRSKDLGLKTTMQQEMELMPATKMAW